MRRVRLSSIACSAGPVVVCLAMLLWLTGATPPAPVGSAACRADADFIAPQHGLDWYRRNWQPHLARPGVAACFANGTHPDVVAFVNQALYQPTPDDLRYNISSRWSGAQGTPRALTWSFLPDGVSISSGVGEPTAPSNLFATLDAQFASQGGRAVWVQRFQQCFDRWAQLCGTSYSRITVGGNDWDDGASWGSSAAATRGDVRIGMKIIDGGGGILAYNYFPSNGDMVIDSGDNWGVQTNQNRFFRNTLMHEHGHGLGISHVCPANGSKLMEPFLNSGFDGPRHDDIRAAQRHYGDFFEENDSIGALTILNAVEVGSPLVVGTPPSPPTGTNPPNSSILSLDGTADADYFRFTVNGPRLANVTVTPRGLAYDSCAQSGGNCPSGCSINSLSYADLNVQVIDSDAVTVLGTGASSPAGSPETLSNVLLPAAGNYGLRVYSGNSFSQAQLYDITISVTAACNEPSIATPPQSQSAAVGQGVVFSVSASGGDLSYQWRRNTVPLVDAGNISGSTTASLVIDPVGGGDAGTYDVVVSNPCGSITSPSATLQVTGSGPNLIPSQEAGLPGKG